MPSAKRQVSRKEILMSSTPGRRKLTNTHEVQPTDFRHSSPLAADSYADSFEELTRIDSIAEAAA